MVLTFLEGIGTNYSTHFIYCLSPLLNFPGNMRSLVTNCFDNVKNDDGKSNLQHGNGINFQFEAEILR